MKTSWTKGLEKDAQQEMRQHFVASLQVRKRLTEILKEKMENTNNNQLLTDNYDSPNWAFKQADNVGYNRALKEILNLLE